MTPALRALVFVVALSTACAPLLGGGSGELNSGRFGKLEAGPDAQRWLGVDTARAKELGATDSEVIAVEAGAPGDRISGLIEVPDDACALLIARAAESVEDIDLFAYGDDGTVLGSDEAPDKKPALLVCPPHPRRLYVVARIAAGHGLVAVGAQRVRPEDAAKVGRALDARGRPGEATGRLDAWPGLDQRIAEHRRRIGGDWQELRKLAVPLDPRTPTRISALVEQDRCLDVLVVPSAEVSHLDVAALDEPGHIIGRAAAAGRDRALIVCSPQKAALTIEIRPHVGRGVAAVVLARTPEGGSKDLDVRTIAYDLAPVGELSDTRGKHATRLEALGYGKAKLIGEGTLEVGRRSSQTLDLPAGCARIDVLAGRPVRGLEAWLWSADGSLLARERGSGRASMFACTAGSKARLDLEALTLPGKYAVELRVEREVSGVLAQHPLAASRLIARMQARGVARSARQAGAPTAIALDPHRLERRHVLVPLRRCVDLTLALGAGASGAELRVVDARTGDELELSRGTYSTSTRLCGLGRGELRATAEMRVATGSTTALFATRMLAPSE
jgi:hypothetical protein